MKQLPTIEDVLSKPATIDDAIMALNDLSADLKAHADAWENPTLDRYLSAMAAWLQSFRGKVGDKPDWRTFITALEAAKIYE